MPDVSTFPADDDLDMTLRDGLRRLPSPPISADFDARVLAALAQPLCFADALRGLVVSTLRPLLCGAACSVAVTLLALFWTLHTPLSASAPPNAPPLARPLDMAAVDDLLRRPDLGASSLPGWARGSGLPPPGLAPPPARPDIGRRSPAGVRRACRLCPALVTV